FDIKTIGSHYLVIGLIIIMSGQLFLIKDTANMILSISAIIFAIGLNYILFTNLKKESTQRIHIEKLSAELQNSNTKLTNINDRLIEAIKNETRAKENETQQRIKFEELASRFENVNHIFAHDIKNVLAKNRDMFVEIIMGTFGETSEQLKNFLRRLSIDTTNLITSVTNILRSGDNMKADPKPFNIKEAVLDVVVSTKDKADERKIKIETNIDEKEDYIVNADRSLITQHVLKNLIENAVNYNVPNGTVTINLSKKNADTILLSIKDTGWGMTEEDKKSLFKAGGHGPDSIKRNVHTSGFGLFIASQTLNLHNGKVYGISEGRNKGSTFFVELPVKFSGIKTITTKDQKNQLPV
ncbi:MAG: HAMP domain-containing sensor histidine kinase, partial [bacterium]